MKGCASRSPRYVVVRSIGFSSRESHAAYGYGRRSQPIERVSQSLRGPIRQVCEHVTGRTFGRVSQYRGERGSRDERGLAVGKLVDDDSREQNGAQFWIELQRLERDLRQQQVQE